MVGYLMISAMRWRRMKTIQLRNRCMGSVSFNVFHLRGHGVLGMIALVQQTRTANFTLIENDTVIVAP